MTRLARNSGPPPVRRHALSEHLRAVAFENGVDVVGFGDVSEAVPAGFKHLPYGVSIGVVHPALREAMDAREGGGFFYRSRQARRFSRASAAVYDHRDLEGQRVLDATLDRLAALVRRQGYRYFSCRAQVDPMESPFTARMIRSFSHKAAATCSGLGSVGRHGLLNHFDYGPYVSWATLLTNAPLEVAEPVTSGDCGVCRGCVDACPAGAISGRPWKREDGMRTLVDAGRCREYLDEREKRTGQRVCGCCAVTCVLSRLE